VDDGQAFIGIVQINMISSHTANPVQSAVEAQGPPELAVNREFGSIHLELDAPEVPTNGWIHCEQVLDTTLHLFRFNNEQSGEAVQFALFRIDDA
jgi:hypothetical protein